ncbi:MAG: hypothetical protein M0Q40_06025 [Limnochordia bacterium]|nr:hypothetical protein [Limnochordia bacterium]
MKYWEEMFAGFSERMQNIAVFGPLLQLSQKTSYQEYSLPALGLAVMLFVLEDMLRTDKQSTYDNIARLLQELIHRYYHRELSHREALDLTYFLVKEGLMNQGRPHQYEYPDFGTGKSETYKFHLVELADYQVEEKTVLLKLSTAGLELLFKTKEMYNELQISITQLYLRQQIQKGVFDGALRTVEELALAVRTEKERIRQLEERIIQDVLQVAREHELEKQIQRINEQLQREQEVFKELTELIDHTMEQYQQGGLSEREERGVQSMMTVRRRLLDIIYEHESLFKEKLRVHQLMLQSIEAMILTSFTTKVNFDTEFLQPAVGQNASINVLKGIIDPILPIRINSFFHPGRALMPQYLQRDEEEELTTQEVLELDARRLREEEAKERALQLERLSRLESFLLLLLRPLIHHPEVLVSNILNELAVEDYEKHREITGHMDFYTCLVQLHQLGVVPLYTRNEVDLLVLDDLPQVLVKLAASNPGIHGIGAFEVIATDRVITLPQGYVMSDFLIRRHGNNGVG